MGSAAVQPFTPPSSTRIALPILSGAQRDFTDPEALTQARYELDRARDFGGAGDMAAWAERWGPGLLDREPEVEDTEPDTPAEVDTGELELALDAVRAAVTEIDNAMKGAVGALNLSDLAKSAATAVAAMAKADAEVDKL